MRAWIHVLDASSCYECAARAEKSPHYKAQDWSELLHRAVCTKKSGLNALGHSYS